MRGAIIEKATQGTGYVFQLTLPMRGAIRVFHRGMHTRVISTHTPHAGSDSYTERDLSRVKNFNSHSPCGERSHASDHAHAEPKFQLTLPMRGAIFRGERETVARQYFNSHSPCGERCDPLLDLTAPADISTHTPHAGSDN